MAINGNLNEPPTRGQPPKRGQKLCSQSVSSAPKVSFIRRFHCSCFSPLAKILYETLKRSPDYQDGLPIMSPLQWSGAYWYDVNLGENPLVWSPDPHGGQYDPQLLNDPHAWCRE